MDRTQNEGPFNLAFEKTKKRCTGKNYQRRSHVALSLMAPPKCEDCIIIQTSRNILRVCVGRKRGGILARQVTEKRWRPVENQKRKKKMEKGKDSWKSSRTTFADYGDKGK